MSINGVSFQAQDLQTLINQKPTPGATIAATNIYNTEPDSFQKSESSTGKKIAKTLLIGAAIAGGLAALRGKTEMFSKIDLEAGIKSQEGILNKSKYAIAKAGQAVIDSYNSVKKILTNTEKKPD